MKQEKTAQKSSQTKGLFRTLPNGEEVRRVWRRNSLRKVGLILTAISSTLLSSTLSLPWYVPALATAAGITGSILAILTQPDPPADKGSQAKGAPLHG